MRFKAVAFDVDGTLYPNALMYIRSVGFALTHVRLLRAYSRVRREVRQIRPLDDLRATEARMLADRLGVSDEEASRQINEEIHLRWEATLDSVPLFPHVRSVLHQLRDAGLRMGVVSDFPVERKLARLSLDKLFDCSLWSEDTGYLKPHPEPFLEIARLLDVPAPEVLFVGNSYSYDVLGAHGVGMGAAHVARRPAENTIADFTFFDYRDLASWVLDSLE